MIGTHYHGDLTGTKNATFVAQNSELKLAKSAIWLCTTNVIAKRIQRLSENWSLWFLWVIWFWVKSLRLFQVIFRLWTSIRTLYYTWLLSVSPWHSDKRIIEQLRLQCLAQGHFGLQTAAEPLTFQLVDECHPSQMTESESVNPCQHEM